MGVILSACDRSSVYFQRFRVKEPILSSNLKDFYVDGVDYGLMILQLCDCSLLLRNNFAHFVWCLFDVLLVTIVTTSYEPSVGEKILKLAEICRKFETEEEKVLPFYSSVLTPKEQEGIEENNLEELTEELAKVMVDYTGMENFWKRYNKVKLEQLSLQHRRAQLLDINGKLREMLKQYLDGISVSDEVLSQLNPLFIVNYQSNLPQPLSIPTAHPGDKQHPTT
ncbi:PREDICTED: coiled-coil domain-containing protein 65-like [Colobus angolensis palliatus]|uniref:coiled-coil domain-containing protein 65-like n=1 Tax=Colobus angolensis palliatus TaxID=336983 RepID=UPI0005F3815D|nr:PREDICTED: coiled-coil domain-containing protein 65-like [Colobus angolensis palliatus]